MENSTRRHFLKDLGLGTAAFSVAAEGAQTSRMPGQPPSSDTQTQASSPLSIMAIAAHPGDAFFAMGAAVALQVHLGGKGVFLSLSLGERGSARIAPAEYGLLQREAAERAAHGLGARAEFLAYLDGEIPVSEEVKFAVCDSIREHQPTIVVTHWYGSWHKDHEACYKIVNDAVFYAGLPALARKQPPHEVQKVLFADNWEDAKGFTPDTFLDISPVFDRWMEACSAFPMWRGENGFRYNDYYGSLAVVRGCLSGCKYAVALMSPPEQLTRRVKTL
ncbi:MAG TPA: PIG-L deacetylase family protein [Terriglobia bacterium]|nr:PIG-L deacetylase family protein [Terriglobia bacterium]